MLLFEAMLVCRKLVVRCCAMLIHVPNRRIRESVLQYYASTHSQSKRTYKEILRQITILGYPVVSAPQNVEVPWFVLMNLGV